MTVDGWRQMVGHLVTVARREAEQSARATTRDRLAPIQASFRRGRETREQLDAWALKASPAELEAAVTRFFDQNPSLRPRTDAEEKQMRAEREARHLAAHSTIVPGETIVRHVNGEDVTEPVRHWHAAE